MTDNEIIKAFEHLVKNANNHNPITEKMLLEDVLDVLNRQKAEIERLKEESDEWARRFINRCRDCEFEIQQNEKLKAEIEKKNTEIDILIEKKDTLQDENSELMAEVERVKEEIKDLKREMSYAVYPNTIGDKHEMGCW